MDEATFRYQDLYLSVPVPTPNAAPNAAPSIKPLFNLPPSEIQLLRTPRLVISITTCDNCLVALCDDGSIWQRIKSTWLKMDDLP